jgi:outer membrane protein, multidrug efflux system
VWVREAHARRGVARADLFPTLEALGMGSRSQSPQESGTGMTSCPYPVNFDAGWELDIFGGVRRSVEPAEADLRAIQEDLRDVLVSPARISAG